MDLIKRVVTEYFDIDIEFKFHEALSHSRATRIDEDFQFVIDSTMAHMRGLLRSVEAERRSSLEKVGI